MNVISSCLQKKHSARNLDHFVSWKLNTKWTNYYILVIPKTCNAYWVCKWRTTETLFKQSAPYSCFRKLTYVSPVTAALWASLPFPPKAPLSIYFFALSQAPPEVLRKRAIKIPETVANMSMPATALAPSSGWSVACPTSLKTRPKQSQFKVPSQSSTWNNVNQPFISEGAKSHRRDTGSVISRRNIPKNSEDSTKTPVRNAVLEYHRRESSIQGLFNHLRTSSTTS